MDTSKLCLDMQNSVFYIFSNIIFSNGYCQSLIVDTQHKKTYFVPNSFVDFVHEIENHSLREIYQNFSQNKEIVDEYLDFIVQSSIGAFFRKSEIENFAKMSCNYVSPYHFENAIIDVTDYSNSTEKIILKINELGVGYIQLRFLKDYKQIDLDKSLNLINNLSFEFCSLVLPYSSLTLENQEAAEKKFAKYLKLDNITIYGYFEDKIEHDRYKTIAYTSSQDIGKIGCGAIRKEYFSVDTKHILQSINFNTCLYKKIYISELGIIKNCPYSTLEYGNIFDLSEKEMLNFIQNKEFRCFWNITKDQIEVCKDCEHRYVCTDCRCFIKDPDNIYSQPAKCTYNPYIAKWQGEAGYVPVEDCGIYSKETSFIPDAKKIAEIKHQL